jgi:hypothetical protein
MTGQRISDVNKAGGSTGAKGLTRCEALVRLGVGALVTEQALLNGRSFANTAGAALASAPNAKPIPGSYAPEGPRGRRRAAVG